MTSYSKTHTFNGTGDIDKILIALYSLGGRADDTAQIRQELNRIGIEPPNSNNIGTCVKAWSDNNFGAKVIYSTGQILGNGRKIVNIRLLSIDKDIADKIKSILDKKQHMEVVDHTEQPSLQPLQLLDGPVKDYVEHVQHNAIDIADAILIRVSELLELEERISSGEFSVDKVKALEDTVEKTIAENNQLLDMIRKLNDEVQELNSKLDSKPNLSVLDRFAARQQATQQG